MRIVFRVMDQSVGLSIMSNTWTTHRMFVLEIELPIREDFTVRIQNDNLFKLVLWNIRLARIWPCFNLQRNCSAVAHNKFHTISTRKCYRLEASKTRHGHHFLTSTSGAIVWNEHIGTYSYRGCYFFVNKESNGRSISHGRFDLP